LEVDFLAFHSRAVHGAVMQLPTHQLTDVSKHSPSPECNVHFGQIQLNLK